jgi:hypothetical protein
MQGELPAAQVLDRRIEVGDGPKVYTNAKALLNDLDEEDEDDDDEETIEIEQAD